MRVIAAVTAALAEARPGKVVCLSTIGAQATQENLLTQLTRLEQALGDLPIPVTFLRPGWFMQEIAENIGFRSACNFTTAFRERLGVTPSQYRRSARQEALPEMAHRGG